MLKNFPVPVIGFAAYSGTGKTTLLAKLIPALKQYGLRVAVLKHAHHHFDIDHPGKDSHTLRQAGAQQVLVASKKRWALISELDDNQAEVPLAKLLQQLDLDNLNLVLIEGYKAEAFPKIELHRKALNKPWLHNHDDNIIAIATDHAHDNTTLPVLDMNNINSIASFILDYFQLLPQQTEQANSR